MKKLLSLLSVLTINGTAVPTTIAASPYQKQIYRENLKRNKRQNNKQNIFGISEHVITTSGKILSSGVILNNKIYFSSYGDKVYEYNPTTGKQKVVLITSRSISSSGVALNNKLYFSSDNGKVYEYDPATEQQKVVITTSGKILSSGVILNNKIYFGSTDGKVYEYNPTTGKQKVVITTNGNINYSGVVLNDKLYIGSYDHNVYEYDPATEQQKIVITTDRKVLFSGVVLNNKLYFIMYDTIYEYDPATEQQKVGYITFGTPCSSGVVLNNKIYFSYDNSNICEFDIFQLIESKFIDIRHQIKRGLYLHYKKQNPNSEIKIISNINLKNLKVFDVIIESKQKNKPLNLENELNVCIDSNSTFVNNSNSEQTQYTIACSKQVTETNTIQKMNGFSKSESTANNDNWTAK
ncbi:outer membrane protein assembly factor BamB family protein, partial [Spiroplasma endosymbiont of Megaselia nigra]|uniref:outer membrane protein assembly factor BamB family protein n=1 Tax=Spiroplasma endosymbiont of Megaselia nigra TaxID=2478537 RepID=UPI000FC0B834